MQNLPQQPRANPLSGLMRKPKLKIKLPSNGKFWPNGSINISESGEYDVYSMTAKDEILLKNPGTQAGGQAVVNVIQSCIPEIVNAWETPGLDLDTILVAIRVATYGPILKTSVDLDGVTTSIDVDLLEILDNLLINGSWEEQLILDTGMIVFLKPLPYKKISKAGADNVETQKIMEIVNDKTMSEDEKLELFKESFSKLTDVTISIVSESIFKIITDDGVTVEDPKFINEFIQQCDREIFNQIRLRMNQLGEKISIKPVLVPATDNMIANGSPEKIEVPIAFNSDTFFA
jgi:hypothetical protein